MKRLPLLALIAASTAFATPSGTTVIVNGTAIDPGTGKIMPNAAITIEGDHITAIKENSTDIPKKGDVVIDARGKFILPGYIDTHVHFFQSGGLFTRPDAVDLTSVRPLQGRDRDDQAQPAGRLRALPAQRDHFGPRYRRAALEFRNAQDRELDRESAAGGGGRSAHLQRVASAARSGRSADREDRYAGAREPRWCRSLRRKSPTTSRFGTS